LFCAITLLPAAYAENPFNKMRRHENNGGVILILP
jgi:hypothetical protein